MAHVTNGVIVGDGDVESGCTDQCTLTDPLGSDMQWGYKLVGHDLATDNHQGGRHRYRPGQWHTANPAGRTLTTVDDCPTFPGDGLCVARTLAGAQSGGQRLGRSVMLIVGWHPADVLVDRGGDKLRVRRLWVYPDPQDPVGWALGPGADLTGADLTGAYLTGAYLAGADLTGADLTRAYLTGADLAGAYLAGAYLTRADLTGAYLTGAYLTGAYLTGAYLTRADLTGADLTGAYVGSRPWWLPDGWTVTANGYITRETAS